MRPTARNLTPGGKPREDQKPRPQSCQETAARRAAAIPDLPDRMLPEDRVRLIRFVYSPAMESLCHLLLRSSATVIRERLGIPETAPYDLDSDPPFALSADDIRAMHPQATESDAQAYVHFAAAARELSMTPADFLAFFRRERHDLANWREGARQLGWSPLESAVSFFRRMRAQD